MESYMVMLYVTIEQEIELKKFFMNRGWPYCKTDLSMMTDHIGPLTGQVPHLTRQTLGLGPSLSPTLTEAQLVQLEAHRKRAAEHEAETPPPKKQVPEPVSTSAPTTILAPAAPALTVAIAKTPAPTAPSPAVAALVPSAIVDTGSAVRAGSSPKSLSQEKEMLVDQEPVRVKMEPGDLKTYSKVKQRVDDKETPSGKGQGKPSREKTPLTTTESQVLKLVSLIPAKPPGVKVVHATEILAGRTIVHSSPTSPVLKTGSSQPSTPITKPANSQKGAEGVASQAPTFYSTKKREPTVETIIVQCPGPVVNPNPTEKAGMQSYMKNITKSKIEAKKANMKVTLKGKKAALVKQKASSKESSPEKGKTRKQASPVKTKSGRQVEKQGAGQKTPSRSPKKSPNGQLKTLRAKAVKRAAAVGVKKTAIKAAKKYKMLQTLKPSERPKRIIKKKIL